MKSNISKHSIEKVYPMKSRRKTKKGEEYFYTNYEVFIPYEYLQLMNIDDCLYMYWDKNKVYLTGSKPDEDVKQTRLSIHKQKGSPTSRKYKPEETENNEWKRFFIVSKKFFPDVSENKSVVFTIDSTKSDKYSDVPYRLNMKLTNNLQI